MHALRAMYRALIDAQVHNQLIRQTEALRSRIDGMLGKDFDLKFSLCPVSWIVAFRSRYLGAEKCVGDA